MVKIVSREMQPLPQPNYTGYSRGARADRSGEIMGKGFSSVISQLAGVGEYMIQKDMDSTISSAVAELDKQLGLDVAQQQQTTGPTSILPDKVKREYDSTLSSLTAAKNQGKLSQEEYVMRLREVQKGLLSKYPGAYKEISDAFRKRTGFDPAIQARKEIFQTQAAAQRQAIQDRKDFARLLESAANKGVVNPKEAEMIFKESMSNPEKGLEYKALLTKRLAARGQIEAEKSFLELKAKRAKLEENEVEKVASKFAADYTRNFLDGAIKVATGGYSVSGLRKMVEDYAKDGILDPKEQRALEMTAFKLQEGYKAGLMKLLYEPSEKGGKSLAEMLGPEGTQKFVENHMKTFVTNFITPLTGKKVQIDLFETNKRTLDAVENFTALKMYGKDPVLQTVAGLRKILGENYGLVLKNSPAFRKLLRGVKSYDGEWVQFNFGRSLQNGESLSDALKRNKEAYHDNPNRLPAVNKATIGAAVEACTNKELNADGRAKSCSFLYRDPDLLSKIKPEERQKLFDELVNPETVRATSALAKQDPAVGEQFADFVTRSSTIVLKRQFEELRTNAEKIGIKLVFENGKFAVDSVEQKPPVYGGGGLVPGFQTDTETNTQLIEMQVERLNQRLDTLNKALHGVGANGKRFIENLSRAFVPEAFPVETKDTAPNRDKQSSNFVEQPQGDIASLSPEEMKGSSPAGPEEQTLEEETQQQQGSQQDPTTIEAVAAIKQFEGFRTKAYRDSKGVWTVGYGFTKGVKPGTTISKQEAEQRLAEELKVFSSGVKKAVRPEIWSKLSPKQQAALISLAYNIGTGRFRKSTLVRKLNRGDINGAAKEFMKWTKIRKNGKLVELRGLRNRRMAEYKMFTGR